MKKIITIKNILLTAIMLFTLNSFSENLYDVKTQWLNTENKEVRLDIYKGHYTLITMVYSGCAHACPMTIAKIKTILKDFELKNEKDIKILLASFDVKNDRPEKLKSYQKSKELDFSKWSFLSAKSEENSRELAVILNINYKDLGEGNFSHSNVITLLNPKGEIIGSIQSLNASAQDLVTAYEKDKKEMNKK